MSIKFKVAMTQTYDPVVVKSNNNESMIIYQNTTITAFMHASVYMKQIIIMKFHIINLGLMLRQLNSNVACLD